MYPGHFAAGLALKAYEPKAATSGLMVAVGLLDLIFGVLVILGIEGGGHRTGLNVPWSHSLLTSALIALLFAALFRHQGRRVVIVIFAAVMSHWVLDVFVHGPDMPLWPYAPQPLGFRSIFGGIAGWFEVVFTLAAMGWYVKRARNSADFGSRWPWACVVIVFLYALEFQAAN
jgi:membrane-bound metal-dependent hydrolase YbcI (DUF457 family)